MAFRNDHRLALVMGSISRGHCCNCRSLLTFTASEQLVSCITCRSTMNHVSFIPTSPQPSHRHSFCHPLFFINLALLHFLINALTPTFTAANVPELHHELDFPCPRSKCAVWAMRIQYRISSRQYAASSSGTRSNPSAFDVRRLQDTDFVPKRRPRRQVSARHPLSCVLQLFFYCLSNVNTTSGAAFATTFRN